MKENYSIRGIEKEHIASLVDLVRSSFESNYIIPSIYRGAGIIKFVEREIENQFSPYRYFVLWDGEVIAGYAEFKIFENTTVGFLNIIAVHNHYKGRGIGHILLGYAKDWLIKEGFTSIQLDVYESNSIALNWYTKFGFERIGVNLFAKIKLGQQIRKTQDIYLQNWPQYKELHDVFGFYFLEFNIGLENTKIGVIGDDLIIRATYSNILKQNIDFISNTFGVKNVYFIGNDVSDLDIEPIDKIIRMKLNLN